MRISDWSSDVCSSDLQWCAVRRLPTSVLLIAAAQAQPRHRLCRIAPGWPVANRGISYNRRLLAAPDAITTRETSCATSKHRSEEHTSELQSLMRISYAVFCLKKKKQKNNNTDSQN